MTIFINLGQGYGYNCDLDHLQDVYIRKFVERYGCFDNDDPNYLYGDCHIDLEGL